MSTPKITSFNYSAKDYAAMRADLIARIPILTNNAWTDINEGDTGIAIVELLTAMMDNLLFYMDLSANEAFLPTARQRADVINLAKLIDYQPASITSARAAVKFDLSNVPAGVTFPVAIPIYTTVSTSGTGGVSFVTTIEKNATDPTPVPVSIPTRNTQIVMLAVEGTHTQDVFVSDGSPNQRFRLSRVNIDTSTVLVKVDSTSWTLQSSFVNAELNDKMYTVDQDASGNTFITFGDGQFGQIPGNGLNIAVDYIVSSGQRGTVGPLKINALGGSLVDNASQAVSKGVGISNELASQAGLSPETIERTKLLAPALLTALYTAKSKDDYNALVLQASTNVTKVNTWGEAEETPPDFRMLNKVQIVFSGRDANNKVLYPVSTEWATVKQNVYDYLAARKIITTRNVIIDPAFVHILVNATVYVDGTRFDFVTVAGQVRQAIGDAFGFDSVNFGQDIYPSQIQEVIGGVAGVNWSTVLLTASPSLFTDHTTRYVLDTTVTPARVVGIVCRKYELPIFEDDAATGFTSGLDPHITVTVVDATDLPRPPKDIFGDPCVT